ncbi:uncharacterized protein M421DRAFT_104834 [Didymella exigua CBS 183.55]|uniref:Uncharacterized protein n=1 Tax=Didymella exigua CBS 183.55 TaxID=1150837 RepID=A0A6A5R6E4_9PLEO|nr:uncharacterized protein M421DRAFT_104834 [Didymella exigua CBS 183.55]KAF1922780.1 hypothetical protein M421DRAFT_104834 [Didymella exigua CBS 183.55]
MDDYDEAVLFTCSLLESRLARLEYLLSGPPAATPERPQTIPERMHAIEQSLQQLAGKTALLDRVNELLTKHKDVLAPPAAARTAAPLSVAQKSALVVGRATSLSTVASSLASLADSSIPDTSGFVKLAALRPRIAEAEARQLQQALKVAELRRRSGLVVQRDRQVLGIAGGRAWAGHQERLVKGYRVLQGEARRRAQAEEGFNEHGARREKGFNERGAWPRDRL